MGELPPTAEVAIIGGGVIGLAVARSLAMRGVNDVVVIERADAGAEASSAAAGMLAPQAEADCADNFFELCRQGRDLYPAFAAELYEETGIDIHLENTGTLYVGFNDEDVKELERRFAWQSGAGLAVDLLTAAEAKELEPSISDHVRLALKFPLDGQVENRLLVRALVAANKKRGVYFASETSANAIRVAGGRIQGLETSRGFIATRNVVIAAGAWSSYLKTVESEDYQAPGRGAPGRRSADSSLPNLGIEPVRGQMLCFDARLDVFRHVIYSPRGYLVPRSDGRILAGSTTEHVGFDKGNSREGVRLIRSAAMEISPAIAALGIKESWSGLRPRAKDGLPVLGAYAEIEGLFYATGHYRNGILLAPITGELVAAAVVGRTSTSPSTFAADRFSSVYVS